MQSIVERYAVEEEKQPSGCIFKRGTQEIVSREGCHVFTYTKAVGDVSEPLLDCWDYMYAVAAFKEIPVPTLSQSADSDTVSITSA